MPDFDLDAAIERLDALRRLSSDEQRQHREELNTLFETVWQRGVDRATFSRLFTGIILTPDMLWMVGRLPVNAGAPHA